MIRIHDDRVSEMRRRCGEMVADLLLRPQARLGHTNCEELVLPKDIPLR